MYAATRTPRELKVGGAEMGFWFMDWTMCEDSQEACSKDPGCYDFFQDRFVTEMDDGVRVHVWAQGLRWRACEVAMDS